MQTFVSTNQVRELLKHKFVVNVAEEAGQEVVAQFLETLASN